MAGFALLLRYLTWPQAAALALAALAFNALALARVAPGIIRPTDTRGIRAGVLFYPLSVLLLVLAFPNRLDIAAAAWGVMAFGDGFATLAGTRVGGPRLPWNRDKSWSGLVAFVLAGSIGAMALSVWVAPAVSPHPPLTFSVWAPVAAAIVAAFVETLPNKVDDNVSVPAAAGAVLWFLAQLNWVGPAGALVLDLSVGVLVSIPLALAAWKVGSITIGGALTGVIFAGVIYASLYLAGLVVLGIALALTLLTSRAGRATKAGIAAAKAGGERRGVGNIVANCVVGTLGAALELFSFDWGLELAAAWFVAGIAAGASDTVASEIGKAWGGTPRSFPTWQRVAPGTPGAVSTLGTLAGVIAAALMTLPAAAMWLIPSTFVIPIVLASTCGAFLESALATRFEADGILDNNTLNFLNTAAAAALAVWWCARLSDPLV
jgi:uncharacterized protein (TIGR00297 family)